MMHFAEGSLQTDMTLAHARELVRAMLRDRAPLRRVLLIPPDHTRAHSWAGELTVMLWEELRDTAEITILPALGTHSAMKPEQLSRMFPGIPHELFRPHRWREDVQLSGTVPAEFVSEVSGGKLNYPIQCEVNRLLLDQPWDAIFSIGQLVPHEVVGIANHNKNIVVGVGGKDAIDRSHFLGAVCGMESIMGRARTPVRQVFDYMSETFLADLPIVYLLTVRAARPDGSLATRGLFCGTGREAFHAGAPLCASANIDFLDEPIRKAVVWLDPHEFKSTWLGNKAIYRLRMAMADDGELIILGPAVREFGEDPRIDGLIRKYGYKGTPATLRAVEENPDLAASLSAAAHLVHGSSEGRFRVTWAAGGLTRAEVESVGYEYGDVAALAAHYGAPDRALGWNTAHGERYFFVPNPALGLWSLRSNFTEASA